MRRRLVLVFGIASGLGLPTTTLPKNSGRRSIRAQAAATTGGMTTPMLTRGSTFVKSNSFVLGMALSVGLAAVKPSLGVDGSFLRPEKIVGDYGVALVFLLSGLSLKLTELRSAVMNVRLNSWIQVVSLIAWPLGVWGLLTPLRGLGNPKILDGVLVTACLPTTINMCVMLTSSAGGNVAAALANAVVGNFLGVFVTPMFLFLTMRKAVTLPVGQVISKLAVKVLFPVALGQLLRCSSQILAFQAKHKTKFKGASEMTLLLICWNAFCNSFTSGLGISLLDVVGLEMALGLAHLVTLVLLKNFFSSVIRASPPDAVAAAFVSSQKTLAMGLPLIKTVFAGSPDLASFCAPIMLLHPTQLLLGSLLVPHWQRWLSEKKSQRAD